MIGEIIKAALMGTAPVAAFTFLILQWSIASGRMDAFEGEESLQKQYKEFAKAKKKAKKEAQAKSQTDGSAPAEDAKPMFRTGMGGDMFHNKIMSFGGGFYGTMAVLTYLMIETIEIWDFLGKVFGPGSWFENLGFGLILDFIINSIMNFVAAFIWFLTLPKYISAIDNGWIWLGAAYLGYLAGLKLTTQHGDTIWEKLERGARDLENSLVSKVKRTFATERRHKPDVQTPKKPSADGKS